MTIATQSVKKMNIVRKMGFVYAAMFFLTVALGYIPGFTDANGALFGLFVIELKDDLLHLASGIWALLAAWHSTRATIFYFKVFGVVYFLDGVLGVLTGYGYLDGGIFFAFHPPPDMLTRLAANAPHLAIGGLAIFTGFVISRRLPDDA